MGTTASPPLLYLRLRGLSCSFLTLQPFHPITVPARCLIYVPESRARMLALPLRPADVAILVYDVTSAASFERVRSWIKELRQMVTPSTPAKEFQPSVHYHYVRQDRYILYEFIKPSLPWSPKSCTLPWSPKSCTYPANQPADSGLNVSVGQRRLWREL